jgi:hypothetical protein
VFGPEVGGNRGIGSADRMWPAEWGREGREGEGKLGASSGRGDSKNIMFYYRNNCH